MNHFTLAGLLTASILSASMLCGCTVGTHTVTVAKGGAGTGTNANGTASVASNAFDSYQYNETADKNGRYSYLESDQLTDIASTPTSGKGRMYDGGVVLALRNNHTYNLFYSEYIVQKDAYGNNCEQMEGPASRVVQPQIYSVEKDGQWSETAQQLTLTGIGTAAKSQTSGKAGITLSFSADVNKTGLQGKPILLTQKKSGLNVVSVQKQTGTEVVTENAANSALDQACGTVAPQPAAPPVPQPGPAPAQSATGN